MGDHDATFDLTNIVVVDTIEELVAVNSCQESEGNHSNDSAKTALIEGKAFNMMIVRLDLRESCNQALSPDPKPALF